MPTTITFGHPQFYGLDRVIKARGRINCIVVNILLNGKVDFDGTVLRPEAFTNIELWAFIYSLWRSNRESPRTIWRQMCASRESTGASPTRFVSAIKYVNRLCTGRRGASKGKLETTDLITFIDFALNGHDALAGPELDGDVNLGYLGALLDVLERRVARREQLLQHKLKRLEEIPEDAVYRTRPVKVFANGRPILDDASDGGLIKVHVVSDTAEQ